MIPIFRKPGILWIARPLSLLEAFIGARIIKKMTMDHE